MRNNYLKHYLFLFALLVTCYFYGQTSSSHWTKTTVSQRTTSNLPQKTNAIESKFYVLNTDEFNADLKEVPSRDTKTSSQVIIEFPNADGTFDHYRIFEYSTMHPELQKKFPNIRSFVGYSEDQKGTVIYFSISPEGLHSLTTSQDRPYELINPYNNDGVYEVFSRADIANKPGFECELMDTQVPLNRGLDNQTQALSGGDGKRRTYRLAIGTSWQYSQYHGGTLSSVMAAINTTMTRVNGIYNRELSIKMELVPDNDLLISLAEQELFSNSGALEKITSTMNNLIGFSAYDIGHTFTTASGGKAYLSSVCGSSKGGGSTGLPDPTGEPFNIDYVAHEMGHQFGANHTFNGNMGSCSSNRVTSSAYEPGSGSTIMSYAGICGSQNVQENSSPYFHQISLQEIWNNITTGTGTCAAVTSTGNTPPTAIAGGSYAIPISTPYKLTGSSTDPDGTTSHTYTWEQFDLGPAGLPNETNLLGPLVRSFEGTENPVRFVPKLKTVVDNAVASSRWEKLSAVQRPINFALTVRDNDPRGGQTAVDMMVVTTVASGDPFQVSSQNSFEVLKVGETVAVTWDVAESNLPPVNAQKVNIRLSINGGSTFPFLIASNVANDGIHEITLPEGTATKKARIMVEAADNIFYNVNASNFEIIKVPFLLDFSPNEEIVCDTESAVFHFNYKTFDGYNSMATFTASSLPPGATAVFSPSSASANGTSGTMTITGLNGVSIGDYEIKISTKSQNVTEKTSVNLRIYNNAIPVPKLLSPTDGSAGENEVVTFSWEKEENVQFYNIEISTTPNFSSVIKSETLANNVFTTQLQPATMYYWRVKGLNTCGSGNRSPISMFSTYRVVCDTAFSAKDTPIAIPSDKDNEVYNSVIKVPQNFPIIDVNVNVNIKHSWAKDLKLVLISPAGTEVLLTEDSGENNGRNFTNTVFDQEATYSIANGTSPFTGAFIPLEDLSILYGEMTAGDWRLEVTDLFATDGGRIDEFTLDFCLGQPLSVGDNEKLSFLIYPNPNVGEFVVKLSGVSSRPLEIEVFDAIGRQIYKEVFDASINLKKPVRLLDAQTGFYIVKVSDGERSSIRKIIVD